MLRLVHMFSFLLLLVPLPAAAQGTDAPFDPSRLGDQEIRVLEAALTLTGDFNGRLDGIWGRHIQSALDAWVSREFGRGQYTFAHLRPLLRSYEQELERSGWAVQPFGGGSVSIAAPMGTLRPLPPNDLWSVRFNSPGGTIRLLFAQTTAETMQRRHEDVIERAAPGQTPYVVRTDRRWVTAVRTPASTLIQIRSERFGNAWVTLRFRAKPEDRARHRLMASTIRRGTQPSLAVPAQGLLRAVLSGQLPPNQPVPQIPPRVGTGFYINNTDILTASRNIAACPTPAANGHRLDVIGIDNFSGLALLSGGARSDAWLSIGGAAPRVGESLFALVPRHQRPILQRAATVVAPVYERIVEGYAIIRMDPTAGSLGGPLINGQGVLRGLVLTGRPAGEFGGPAARFVDGREIVAGPTIIAGFLNGLSVLYDRAPAAFGSVSVPVDSTAIVAIRCVRGD